MNFVLFAGLSLLLALPVACSDPAARAQLVVIVDTDLPTVQQAIDDPALSRDVAIDSLRVDVLDATGNAIEHQDFVAPSALDWPISFGVTQSDGPTTLRLRVYRASLATPRVDGAQTSLEPAVVTTVDRFVTLPIPVSGVSASRITMHADCINRPASFLDGGSFCESKDVIRTTDRTSGVVTGSDLTPVTSAVGTWPLAREVPCAGTAPTGAICIPGGITLMGDAAFDGFANRTLPLRLVLLSPFFMDGTELTVGRYRKLLLQNKVSVVPAPSSTDAAPAACTFKGVNISTKDAYPLNCLDRDAAQAACAAAHGTLASEARFEHAARGRGQARRYPWGSAAPSCCAVNLSRTIPGMTPGECKGSQLDVAGSHPLRPTCAGIGDESRDGVLDLGGSLEEWMADEYQEYNEACWSWAGIAKDPLCATGAQLSVRGGTWSDALVSANVTYHRPLPSGASSLVGFRCVYEATP